MLAITSSRSWSKLEIFTHWHNAALLTLLYHSEINMKNIYSSCEGLNYFLKSLPLWSYYIQKNSWIWFKSCLTSINFFRFYLIVFTPQISLPVDFFSTDSRRPGHHHYYDHDHLHSSLFITMIDANCFWLFSKCGKDFLKVIFSLSHGKNK